MISCEVVVSKSLFLAAAGTTVMMIEEALSFFFVASAPLIVQLGKFFLSDYQDFAVDGAKSY